MKKRGEKDGEEKDKKREEERWVVEKGGEEE